jgi:hypothetical protein
MEERTVEINGKVFVFKKPNLKMCAMASKLGFDNLSKFGEIFEDELTSDDAKCADFISRMNKFFDEILEVKPEGFSFDLLLPAEVSALQNFFIKPLFVLTVKHKGVSKTLQDLISPETPTPPEKSGK